MMRLSERGSKAAVTKSARAWEMTVWPLGEPVMLFCVKKIAMGELEISVEGSYRLGVLVWGELHHVPWYFSG
jgi:hypothetical protein